jgi:hypothetical protein
LRKARIGLGKTDPVLIAMTKGLVAGTVNVALAILRGAALPSIEVSGGAAVIGFLGVGVSLVLFVLALRHLGTARTGAYFSLAPFREVQQLQPRSHAPTREAETTAAKTFRRSS